MAKTVTAEVSLGFVYTPLITTSGIEVAGNVPAVQQFDVATGQYAPDYTQTFLQLKPWVEVVDPDGLLTMSDIVLTNMAWHVTEDGTETLISTDSSEYDILADGTLKVIRNIDPDKPASFRFSAQFSDPRTDQVHDVVETILVYAESVSVSPELVLDAPAAFRYDPIRETAPVRKVKARLVLGDNDVPAANVEFVWQKKDPDGVWADILPDDDSDHDIMDYDVSISADGTELTVDCSLVGKRVDIRVYAKYNPFGDPTNMPIGATTPVGAFAVVRHEPNLNKNTRILCPKDLQAAQKTFKPICDVYDDKGSVPNADALVDIEWYMSKSTSAGTVTYGSCLATGTKPTLPTTAVAKTFGAKLGVSCEAKAPLKALTVDGKVLTYNGKVLLGR